ncbi:MAG: putative selenium metabolism protein, YedE family [Firmicutes bacterium]|nr:putative selenium metabolism protein, YedE family [Bacillota bacterium]
MQWLLIIITGIVFGLGAVVLVKAGNPGNYGFCAACHLRDIAGALGIHQVATLQYVRPEILGFILGSFALAKTSGEFRPRGGANPAVRFVLGALMVIGALVFLGCPLRGILRLAGGDLNGLVGLAGFVGGIFTGIAFLKNGYNLGRSHIYQGTNRSVGYVAAIAALVLVVAAATHAGFLQFSAKGPGSMHAPLFLSLVLGLLAGALAWKTRMCLSGGLRDFILVRDTYLLKIYGVIFLAAFIGNQYFGFFKLGFADQPLAHSMHIWNFFGLFLVGLAATLAGGCPLRQLIMAGEGNTDAMFCVLGMLAGAGISHGLNAAGSAAGVGVNGQIAVIAGLLITLAIGFALREKISLQTEG